jgi:formylglycine-generating enzyme required for sulfatase activity
LFFSLKTNSFLNLC